jgi:hypothetical protein
MFPDICRSGLRVARLRLQQKPLKEERMKRMQIKPTAYRLAFKVSALLALAVAVGAPRKFG